MKFAVYASGHGYGHLTRILEIVRELVRLHPGAEIHTRAPFEASRIQDFLGFPPTTHTSIRMDVGLVQYDSLRHDHAASLQRLHHFFGDDGDILIKREAAWMQEAGIDAALIDVPPHAFAASHRAGVPAIGIGNFTWDRVWSDLSLEHPEYRIFAKKAHTYYSYADVFYNGGMELGLEAFKQVEEVPLIARRSILTKENAKFRLGFNLEQPVVLIAFGGEGLKGLVAPSDDLLETCQFVATPPLENIHPAIRFMPEEELTASGLRYNDLVRAADIALLKPGYSTVAECAANETGVVIVPRVTFPEADVIQRYVEENLPSVTLPTGDLLAGRWDDALTELLSERPFSFKDIRCDGAEVVARKINERYC